MELICVKWLRCYMWWGGTHNYYMSFGCGLKGKGFTRTATPDCLRGTALAHWLPEHHCSFCLTSAGHSQAVLVSTLSSVWRDSILLYSWAGGVFSAVAACLPSLLKASRKMRLTSDVQRVSWGGRLGWVKGDFNWIRLNFAPWVFWG